jgi:hypothetical protein
MKMLVMFSSTIGSAVGWWAGAPFGIMTAFMMSMVGTAIGVWAGRRLATHWGL